MKDLLLIPFGFFHFPFLPSVTMLLQLGVYVVVQFYPWSKFNLPLFLVMVMVIMSLKQRKIKFKPKIKLNHQHI